MEALVSEKRAAIEEPQQPRRHIRKWTEDNGTGPFPSRHSALRARGAVATFPNGRFIEALVAARHWVGQVKEPYKGRDEAQILV